MTINSAIMLELARQRHLDIAHGVANAQRPAPARHGSTPNRRRVYRTRLAMVTAVVAGTLMWAAVVTGLAGLTPAPANTATGTEVTATAYQAHPPNEHVIATPDSGNARSTPNHGNWNSTPNHGNWG